MMLAQLRSVLAAVESAEVAQEDQYDRPIAPQVAESVNGAVDARQREARQ
jgi:hypothetical protein